MKASAASEAVHIKDFIEFRKNLEPLKKDKINPQFRSGYISLDQIISAVTKPLAEYNFTFTQSVSVEGGLVSCETTLLHTSGSTISTKTTIFAGEKHTPQGSGSAFTYAKRYGLSSLLGIAADEDDDGNAAEVEAKKAPPQKAVPEHLKRLYALADTKKWSVAEIAAFIKEAFGVKSSSELSEKDCNLLIQTIENMNFNDAMEDLRL